MEQVRAGLKAISTQEWAKWLRLAVAVFCFYVLAAKLSLAVLTPDGVAVFWPAAGVAAGTLIALGPSARWAVAIATLAATVVANLMGDRNLPGAVVFGLCNAAEALIVAGLLERYLGSPFDLKSFRRVLGLLCAAAVAAAISGIGGAFGFTGFYDPKASLLSTWQNWFASDALGILAISPFIIEFAAMIREPPQRREAIEGLAALGTLAVAGIIALFLPAGPWAAILPVVMLFAILLWIAARCGTLFAATATLMVTVAIVLAMTLGIGQLGGVGSNVTEHVFAARLAILTVGVCALVLAALFAERRQHTRELAESATQLQEALSASGATTFKWILPSDELFRSANAAQVLGFEAGRTFGAMNFLTHVHAEDRDRLRAVIRRLDPDHPSYALTFRFACPDGRTIWLEEQGRAEFDGLGRLASLRGFTLDVTARKHYEVQAAVTEGAKAGLNGRERSVPFGTD